MGASDIEDLITAKIIQQRVEEEKTTVQRETTVLADRISWKKWSEKYFIDDLFVQTNSSSGFIIDQTKDNFIKLER